METSGITVLLLLLLAVTPDVSTLAPTSQPSSVLFESGAPVMLEGDPVQMSCPSVQAKSSLIYSWSYRNRSSSHMIPIGSTKTLPKKTARPEDSGEYLCIVYDGYYLYKFYMELTVVGRYITDFSTHESQPALDTDVSTLAPTSQPSSVLFESGAPVMLEGDPVQMSCPSVQAKSSLIYSWSYRNRSSSHMIPIGSTKTLPKKTARPEDSGEYLCIVYDGYYLYKFYMELTVVGRYITDFSTHESQPALDTDVSTLAPTSLPSSVLFESGAPVMLEGDPVQMSCPSVQAKSSLIYSWSYRNRSSSHMIPIGSTKTLPKKTARPEDSGQYNCTVYDHPAHKFSTELTVVEKSLPPLVVAGSQGFMVIEGSGLVTLKCVTSSGPSPVSWRWYRLAGAGLPLVEVGQEQELSLGRTADSGEYLCRAETSTLGLTQMTLSDSHQVIIIPSSVAHPVGIAALVFLCLLLLVLVAVWLFIQRERETAALHKQANGSPAKRHPGPGMELKEDSKTVEDEVYMNCETSGEGYTDLNHDEIPEENTYDCLS